MPLYDRVKMPHYLQYLCLFLIVSNAYLTPNFLDISTLSCALTSITKSPNVTRKLIFKILIQFIKLFIILFKIFVLQFFIKYIIANSKHIHFGTHKALECVCWCTNYWFATYIKRCVYNEWAPCLFFEF